MIPGNTNMGQHIQKRKGVPTKVWWVLAGLILGSTTGLVVWVMTSGH